MKSLSVGLAIIFCFLMSNIVKAQSAWVLWENHNPPMSHSYWELKEAFPSYEECREAQSIKCERKKDMILNNIIITREGRVIDGCPDTLSFVHKDSFLSYLFVYKCFPDTIDPRK